MLQQKSYDKPKFDHVKQFSPHWDANKCFMSLPAGGGAPLPPDPGGPLPGGPTNNEFIGTALSKNIYVQTWRARSSWS